MFKQRGVARSLKKPSRDGLPRELRAERPELFLKITQRSEDILHCIQKAHVLFRIGGETSQRRKGEEGACRGKGNFLAVDACEKEDSPSRERGGVAKPFIQRESIEKERRYRYVHAGQRRIFEDNPKQVSVGRRERRVPRAVPQKTAPTHYSKGRKIRTRSEPEKKGGEKTEGGLFVQPVGSRRGGKIDSSSSSPSERPKA